jgi:CelD/BcsL family acetyltransferase involved in cellulose biosynthesis
MRVLTGSIAVRSIDSLSGMEAIAEGWRALEVRCPTPLSYFQTYDWCRAWAEKFTGAGGSAQVFVQTAWRNGELAAVWPLMLSPGPGLMRAGTLGEPFAQYSNLIHDPDLISPADLKAFVGEVLQPGRFDVAVFDAVPQSSPLAALVGSRSTSVEGRDNESLMLDLSGWKSAADYTAQLSQAQTRRRERKRRHLARRGALSFEVIWPDNPEFAPLVRQAVAMKRTWLKETGRLSVGLHDSRSDDFFASLSGSAATLTGACISVLRVADRCVAMEIGFLWDRHYYAYLGAFDWQLAEYSPGKMQMEMTVGWLIDRGVNTYDLLANTADYKLSWSNRAEALESYAVPFSWKGRIYAAAWLTTLKPAIKRAYYAVPSGLRRLVTGMQAAAAAFLPVSL